MDYGLKYYMTWVSERGNDCRIEILEKEYTGPSMLKKLGSAPILRYDNADNGIIGTSLQFLMQADVDGELAELYTTDSKKYKVRYLISGSIMWEGYILQELYSEEYIAPPYDVSITATDQIALLKDEPYKPLGRVSILEIVQNALMPTALKQPFIIQSSLRPSVMSDESTFISQTRINDNAFADKSCYEVLQQIMATCGMTLLSWANGWFIVRNNDFNAPCYIFNESLDMVGKVEMPIATIGRMGEDEIYPSGSLVLTKKPAKKSALLSFAPVMGLSMLQNPQMTSAEYWEFDNTSIFEKPGRIPIEEGSDKTVKIDAFVLNSTKEQSTTTALYQQLQVDATSQVMALEFSYLPLYKLAYLLEGYEGNENQLPDPNTYEKTTKLVVDVRLVGEDGQTWKLTKIGWLNWDMKDSVIYTGEMKFLQPTTIANKDEYTKGRIEMAGFPAKGTLMVGFRNDSRITFDIVPVPTIQPAQAKVAVTDVLLTFGQMKGYQSNVSISPSAAQKADEFELAFSDASGVTNEERIFYNYIDFGDLGKSSTWLLNGQEYPSFYQAMVQDYANSVGAIRNGFSGAIQGAMLPHIMFIEKYSQSQLRLTSGEMNLLTDELSGEWVEVLNTNVPIEDYEITEEGNSTTVGGSGSGSSSGSGGSGGGASSGGVTMEDVQAAVAPFKDWFEFRTTPSGKKYLHTNFTVATVGDVVTGAEEDINVPEGEGEGLKFADERAIFPSQMIIKYLGFTLGEEVAELTDEERQYNIETFNLTEGETPIILNAGGMWLYYDGAGYTNDVIQWVSYCNIVNDSELGLTSMTVIIYPNGDAIATAEYKSIGLAFSEERIVAPTKVDDLGYIQELEIEDIARAYNIETLNKAFAQDLAVVININGVFLSCKNTIIDNGVRKAYFYGVQIRANGRREIISVELMENGDAIATKTNDPYVAYMEQLNDKLNDVIERLNKAGI